MIKASISAVPGLVAVFLVLGTLFALPTAFLARARAVPWQPPAAFAAYVAGILTVTLLPGNAGLEDAQCDAGAPLHLLTDPGALLNIALFAPGAFLGVLLWRRPVTVGAAFVCLSGSVELIQSMFHLGRSCSLTDVAANTLGSILGTCAGALVCRARRAPVRLRRDALWGTSILVLSTVLFTSAFYTRIEAVDIVAKDDARQRRTDIALQANAWLTKAATATFGSGTEIVSSSVKTVGGKQQVSAQTNRGTIAGWWPDQHLESAWSKNNRGDHGSAGPEAAAARADRFARAWFPDSVQGSRQNVRILGEGPTRAYLVTYRRYHDDVLMPMRLDITLTSTKRIIGFNARTIADPSLPAVTVNEQKARHIARQASGQPTESTTLLAQQVDGTWRPVWLVGAGKNDIVIDAATGQQIITK
ncbi:VanZ family protein [Streptomyces sp900105245]|uniref:VanZ family protein n=1 Tax=Streptomyces sp. 900105245 TaxID=3154379 RepID=UPI00331D375F